MDQSVYHIQNKNINAADALLYTSSKLPISCTPAKTKSPCIDQIKHVLEQAALKLGHDYVRYSYWLKDAIGKENETDFFSVNFSNFPCAWERYYNAESLYLYDPVVRIIQDNIANQYVASGTWDEAYDWAILNPLGDNEAQHDEYIKQVTRLIARAHEHHLMSGYYYSWGSDRYKIVVSLGSLRSPNAADPDRNDVLHSLLGMVALINQSIQMTQGCARCVKLLRVDGGSPVVLSEAELRVLQLYRQERNATQKQIALQYGKSVDTVNHHLRSIRRKFNLSGASGHSLVSYAIELNLL